MSIEIANESGVDVPEDMIVDVARFALDRLTIHPEAELSIVLVDNDAMAALHMQWMDLPGPTDVLSFPMDEMSPGRPDSPPPGPGLLGDIVLCPDFAATQAQQARHSLDHELAILTIHGVLHLLGYDHAEPDEEKEMFRLQAELLEGWYSDRRRRVRDARMADRDAKLLNKTGFSRPAQTQDRDPHRTDEQ